MKLTSVIFILFNVIYVNGYDVFNKYEDRNYNFVTYNGAVWNYGDKQLENVQWKGIAESEMEKFSDEYETGVSIGFNENISGKKLKVNEDEVTNEDNFVRPCPFDDWECIRKFMADNSDCKPAYGPTPDPLYLKQHTLFFPLTNMTLTLTDYAVRGFSNSKFIEFYYNKETKDLVFAIRVTNLNITTPKGYFSYRRTAKESIVLADYATILFEDVIITAVIPKLPKLRLDFAELHSDVSQSRPVVFIGPKAYTSKDPDVIRAYADFITFFPFVVREGVFYQIPLYMSKFLSRIYISLVQSVITYCISIWGGAFKTRFLEIERAQRALVKVMYFKKRRYATTDLYSESSLLSIRKLYILQVILKKHTMITYDPHISRKRRKDIAITIGASKRTVFADMQFINNSAHIYNKVNKVLNIYSKSFYECKKKVTDWLHTMSYDEVENLLRNAK